MKAQSDVNSSPDEHGFFDGSRGYGYLSLEKFIGEFQVAGKTAQLAHNGQFSGI